MAFACTNGGCTESQHFGPYSTLAIPEDSSIGIIAGAVAAVVVVIIVIVIIAVFVMRRRNRQKPRKDSPPVVKENKINKQKPRKDPPPVVTENKINKPIVMEDFERTVEDSHNNANLKFSLEYEEIKTLTDPKTLNGVTTKLAQTEENKLKNRYVNILPYDKTIVKLLPLADDDDNATTFINANYIPGYRSQREYIASQGPIPSTIDDFWRMVWEQSVAIIVMLTLCTEKGRIKCECYWPTDVHDPKQYRDIVVELTSFSTLNTYEIRVFKLTMGDTTRCVKHFHFLKWADFGADVQNDVMIDFIQNVRSHVRIPESKVPMIVHCSAGVGRTGTYITLDHWMQFIHDHDFSNSIDIFKTVVEMRKCRMYMVQTEQQYIFIYDCIRDILKKKRLFLREQEEADNENYYGNEEDLKNEKFYENTEFGTSEEVLYDNKEVMYDNKAFGKDLF